MKNRKKVLFIVLGGLIGLVILAYGIIPFFTRDVYVPASLKEQIATQDVKGAVQKTEAALLPDVTHIPTPKAVKAIYMSACAAGTQSFRDHLIKIADTTEVNSIIIDIKDYTGTLSFTPTNPDLQTFVSKNCYVHDMQEFIQLLHKKGIYVIGRITVFQDPLLTSRRPDLAVKRASDGKVWRDHKGLSFIEVGAKDAWDHIVAISKDSYAIGFDELNYDYIRFPSDGNMEDIYFPFSHGKKKSVALEEFFKYLHTETEKIGVTTSADLFGMTTTNTDDLNIGQVLEKALPYFDYIAPMVYPSHYPPHFNGWKNPNHHLYDLIHFVMKEGVRRTVATSTVVETLDGKRIGTSTPALYTKPVYDKQKLRPWLQDFDYGGNYGVNEVKAQIKATYDVGLTSWMLWDPANKYTPEALVAQ